MASGSSTSDLVWTALAFGSNLGARIEMICAALAELQVRELFELRAASSIYETPALGPPQPDYLNQFAVGWTRTPALQFLEAVKRVERDLGRCHAERWSPRVIDIDILTYGAIVVETERLAIPHPGLASRRFVLEPWSEIDAEFVVPGHHATVGELLGRLEDSTEAKKVIDRDELIPGMRYLG